MNMLTKFLIWLYPKVGVDKTSYRILMTGSFGSESLETNLFKSLYQGSYLFS